MKFRMLNRRELTLGMVAVVVAVLITIVHVTRPPAIAQRPHRAGPFNRENFRPDQVVRPFDPIVQPEHVSADVGDKTLGPNELVLGVEINGEARAYPINMLTGPSREIFNDELGNHSIAATL